MKDYKLYPNELSLKQKEGLTKHDVWFDYQNRTGIRVNFMPVLHQLSIWTIHEELEKAVQDGTYEKYVTPGTLAKGIVIRNNYIFTTGHGGIKTTGDGAYIAYNIVRCKPSVTLPTANGLYMDAHVNDVVGLKYVDGDGQSKATTTMCMPITPEGIKYNDGED